MEVCGVASAPFGLMHRRVGLLQQSRSIDAGREGDADAATDRGLRTGDGDTERDAGGDAPRYTERVVGIIDASEHDCELITSEPYDGVARRVVELTGVMLLLDSESHSAPEDEPIRPSIAANHRQPPGDRLDCTSLV